MGLAEVVERGSRLNEPLVWQASTTLAEGGGIYASALVDSVGSGLAAAS